MEDVVEQAQIVVSTDGHAGADIWDYKPYLERRYHDDFDAWASAYRDPWGQLSEDDGSEKYGFVSFDVPINWESGPRQALIDRLGIAAEVLFPNTAPPFVPSGAVSVPPPQSPKEYEYRFAGIKAHNRWMAEFCEDSPGRRIGFVQIFVNDLDAAIAEVRWAKEAGLKGVLLPADHVLGLVNLYTPEFDRLWATCDELEMSIHRHQVFPAQTLEQGGPAAPWIGQLETGFFATRSIAHLLCSGVFERFPDLKFVVTELTESTTITSYLSTLDATYEMAAGKPIIPGTAAALMAPALENVRRKPSEYFMENCFLGAPLDIRATLRAGTPNVMFGADIPHSEGPGKYAREAIRSLVQLLDEPEIDEFLYLRAARAYNLDLGFLQGVADELGFARSLVRTPLGADETPRFPDDSRCRVFDVVAAAQ